MKALSIRQPWCHHILYGGKDVENRRWRTRVRGGVLVHAAKRVDAGDRELVERLGCPLGGIVGMMEIIDCVSEMDSEWFSGPFGFVIGRRRPLPFVPLRGALGFFDVPEEAMSEIRTAMRRCG